MAMTFEELGDALRIEREKQGLSIDDVAHRLKISARVLRAVESADSSSLPHCVYVRGFVLSYAKLLEIDPTEFLTVQELYDSSEDPAVNDPYYVESRTPIKKGTVLLVLLLCVCLAGGAVVWFYRDAILFSQIKTDHLTTAQPAPPVNVEPTVQEQQTPSPPQDTDNVDNSQAQASIEEIKEDSTQSEIVVTEEGDTSNQSSDGVVENVEAPAIQTTPTDIPNNKEEEVEAVTNIENTPIIDGPHRVIITAVAECWVHSIADDSDTRQFSLRAGDTFALTFVDTLSLKLGNAGGVRIRYNGQERPIPGRDGEVKTIAFPPEQ